MSKPVGDRKSPSSPPSSEPVEHKTLQLSLRLPLANVVKIEKIKKFIRDRNGVEPDRVEIIRRSLDFGIDQYCKKYDIDLASIKDDGTLEKLVERQYERRRVRETEPKKKPSKQKRRRAA